MWKNLRKMKGVDTRNHIPFLTINNAVIDRNPEIVGSFSLLFNRNPKIKNTPSGYKISKMHAKSIQFINSSNNQLQMDLPVTEIECTDVTPLKIRNLVIPYKFIQTLPEKAKNFKFAMNNKIWTTGEFPRRWSETIFLLF
ncbi:hypothetical protein WA026_017355 [Henosepilachna vigintioctopunctata]|uniref:Uncharacterized protein n=1 Tax=Henosepilachna vigintioctopunctata TaxID=420089 RepID=A0AAW1VHT7_9CUCU